MIDLHFSLVNPWSKCYKIGKIFYGKITKNKNWELQFTRTSCILRLMLTATARRDHAGFGLALGLLSFEVEFNIYDCRHWDYSTNDWNLK